MRWNTVAGAGAGAGAVRAGDADPLVSLRQAAMGVIHSVAFHESALARDQLHALLSRMAQSALVSRSW